MKFATVKTLAAKLSVATFAAGALMFAGAAPAQAQQFGVAVQFGHPTYVVDRDRGFYQSERARREYIERQRREEFLRHQAWLRQQQWEREHRSHERGYYGHR